MNKAGKPQPVKVAILHQGRPGRANPACRVSDTRVGANQMSWQVQCARMSGSGEIAFQRDSYNGQLTLTSDGDNTLGRLTWYYRGRRVGECG